MPSHAVRPFEQNDLPPAPLPLSPLPPGEGQGEGKNRMKDKARSLRRRQTEAEKRLWQYLRNRQPAGCKFRRQHPISPYIVDFACLEKKLIIELDGSQHLEAKEPDNRRDNFLKEKGFTVLRFWNHEIFAETEAVLQLIYHKLNK